MNKTIFTKTNMPSVYVFTTRTLAPLVVVAGLVVTCPPFPTTRPGRRSRYLTHSVTFELTIARLRGSLLLLR